MSKFIFSKESRDKLNAYAQSIESSASRAQCYNLASLKSDLSIAETISLDHFQHASALRAAKIAVDAGVAREIKSNDFTFGTFVFEDSSTLK